MNPLKRDSYLSKRTSTENQKEGSIKLLKTQKGDITKEKESFNIRIENKEKEIFEHKMKLKSNLLIAFPDTQNDKGVNRHIRIIMEQMHTNQNYAEYLIKKCWLKNFFCSISREDCNIFIRIVKEFIFSSRDACIRQVDILARMEKEDTIGSIILKKKSKTSRSK